MAARQDVAADVDDSEPVYPECCDQLGELLGQADGSAFEVVQEHPPKAFGRDARKQRAPGRDRVRLTGDLGCDARDERQVSEGASWSRARPEPDQSEGAPTRMTTQEGVRPRR